MSKFNFDIKKILVPVDFSDTSLKALDQAINLASLTKAELTMIHIVESLVTNISDGMYYGTSINTLAAYEDELFVRAKNHLQKFNDKIAKKHKIKTSAITTSGWVKEQILKSAKKTKADLIIMGTHGVKGFRSLIMGSNTFRIVNEAECPVLSVQHHASKPGFKNILVPFRDNPHSREKVDYAIAFGKIFGSTIHVLGIDTEESKSHYKKIEREADQIKSIVKENGLSCKIKIKSSGYVADNVLKY
ncbi:MAG: universal stress protein, partial [Bacteroidia bacterium]|nr:universal stress protein [Bacteroidia bacterium]